MKKVARRKNYNRSIQTFFALTLLVLVIGGIYGYFQYQKLAVAQGALADGQLKLAQLRSLEGKVATQYTELQNEFDDDFEEVLGSIQGVFPSEENYTGLTRVLEAFVLSTNKKNPTIIMNNLKFSQSRVDEESGYSVLPFNLTLNTTRENLDKFLDYTENSGSLDHGNRLLDVRSISITFPGQQSTSRQTEQLLIVSLSLNAYFQLPAVE